MTGPTSPTTFETVSSELKTAGENRVQKQQKQEVLQSLLPPLSVEMPRAEAMDLSQRFNIAVSNVSAPNMLTALVNDTRYSVVIHPEVKAPISLNLKNVTIPEVLNSIREMHGYDYRIDGTLIYVLPATLQTRMFKIDYLTNQRRGTTDLRVSSNAAGAATAGGGGGGGQSGAGGGQGAQGQQGGQRGGGGGNSTQVETSSTSNFWVEMYSTLAVLTGCTEKKDASPTSTPSDTQQQILGCDGLAGRRLVVSPQSGTVLVRAMPEELKSISAYLRTSQAAVEKQVLIEAKILEVALKDGYETGVNWAGFMTRAGENLGIGMLTPGSRMGDAASLAPLQGGNPVSRIFPTPLTAGGTGSAGDSPFNAAGRVLAAAADAGGSLFGIAFQGKNFAALMTFLETQGVVHTLSSPRIATVNNQKAVLKVGSDSLFVTRITGGSQQAATAGVAPTIQAPTFDVQSFFSGISLDVTPRISEDGSIVLHVRPSISEVSQQATTFNLGTLGTFTIPLVSNAISETDSVIRAQDGQIVAIGGLMRQVQRETRNQIPGLGNIPFAGAVFRNTSQGSEKRELVILLKPTVIMSDESWARNILESRERVKAMDRGFSWGGRSEVFGTQNERYEPPPQ